MTDTEKVFLDVALYAIKDQMKETNRLLGELIQMQPAYEVKRRAEDQLSLMRSYRKHVSEHPDCETCNRKYTFDDYLYGCSTSLLTDDRTVCEKCRKAESRK